MKGGAARWIVLVVLVLISAKNYLDRQALSVLAPTIQGALHINDASYSWIISAFLIAYAIGNLASGLVVDSIGARRAMALFLGVWSIASGMTGFISTAIGLGQMRVLLGLAEAGGWVAGAKIVGEHFNSQERGFAMGSLSLGGSLGATLAPILIISVASTYGWPQVFILMGVTGLALSAGWLLVVAKERGTSHMLPADANGRSRKSLSPREFRRNIGKILSSPVIWSLLIVRFLTDPIWYFLQFWLPKYFFTERHFGQTQLTSLWIVYLAADIGFIGGGLISDQLLRFGVGARRSRLYMLSALAVIMCFAMPGMSLARGVEAAQVFSFSAALCQGAWMTVVAALIVDTLPEMNFGIAYGVIAVGSALGGVVMNQLVSWSIEAGTYSYSIFALAGLMPAALAILWFCAGRGNKRPKSSLTSAVP